MPVLALAVLALALPAVPLSRQASARPGERYGSAQVARSGLPGAGTGDLARAGAGAGRVVAGQHLSGQLRAALHAVQTLQFVQLGGGAETYVQAVRKCSCG